MHPKHTPRPRPSRHEFLLAEHGRLRSEIEMLLKDAAGCSNFAIVASAAAWAWMLSHDGLKSVPWLGWGPFVVVLLFGLRWGAVNSSLAKIGFYLSQVEDEFELNGLGWESFIRKGRSPVSSRFNQIGTWSILYFAVLLLINAWLATHVQDLPLMTESKPAEQTTPQVHPMVTDTSTQEVTTSEKPSDAQPTVQDAKK